MGPTIKPGSGRKSKGFTDDEKAAMRDRAKEAESGELEGEGVVLAKIAEMAAPDRAMGQRIHAIVRASAPDLTPRLWYRMPAYAKDGKVVCQSRPAQKFKARYATLGFTDKANLDDGDVWPVAFALKELSASQQARIAALVKKAAS